MGNLKLRKQTIALALSLTLAACAGQTVKPFKTDHNSYQLKNLSQLDERQRADLYEAIITADMAEHQQDNITALSYYLYAAELSGNQQLIEKSIIIAKAAEDPLALEQAAKIWLSFSPDNTTAQASLLEAQIELQNTPEALQTANKLFAQEKKPSARYQLIESHILNKGPRVAFRLILELEKQFPTDPAILTAKAKFFLILAGKSQQSAEEMRSQALETAEKALAEDPLFNPAIRIKTHALFQMRRDAQAKQYLTGMFEQNPDSLEISQMLGQLLYDLRDYDAAVSHYARWFAIHPEDQEAQNYLAASYYALGQYHLSLKHFNQLSSKGFQTTTTAFYCGDSAQKLNNIELAINCFSRVNSGRFLALSKIQLARMMIQQEKYQQALDILQTSYQVDENGRIQLLNAEIDLLNKHFSADNARQKLEQALTQNPDNLALILKKIELYQLIDKPEKLNSLLTKARELIEPGQKLDRFNLAAAALFRNNKHYQLAIDWLNWAIERKPDDKDLLYTRALYKEPLGLFEEMISEFKYLLEIYPDDLSVKNALGYTLADIGEDLEYAQALIDSAYQAAPNNAAVIDSKGWIAYRRGALEAAFEYLNRAFKMAPSPEGAAHLGEVLWKSNKREAAKAVLTKGIELEAQNRILLDTLERLKIEL